MSIYTIVPNHFSENDDSSKARADQPLRASCDQDCNHLLRRLFPDRGIVDSGLMAQGSPADIDLEVTPEEFSQLFYQRVDEELSHHYPAADQGPGPVERVFTDQAAEDGLDVDQAIHAWLLGQNVAYIERAHHTYTHVTSIDHDNSRVRDANLEMVGLDRTDLPKDAEDRRSFYRIPIWKVVDRNIEPATVYPGIPDQLAGIAEPSRSSDRLNDLDLTGVDAASPDQQRPAPSRSQIR